MSTISRSAKCVKFSMNAIDEMIELTKPEMKVLRYILLNVEPHVDRNGHEAGDIMSFNMPECQILTGYLPVKIRKARKSLIDRGWIIKLAVYPYYMLNEKKLVCVGRYGRPRDYKRVVSRISPEVLIKDNTIDLVGRKK